MASSNCCFIGSSFFMLPTLLCCKTTGVVENNGLSQVSSVFLLLNVELHTSITTMRFWKGMSAVHHVSLEWPKKPCMPLQNWTDQLYIQPYIHVNVFYALRWHACVTKLSLQGPPADRILHMPCLSKLMSSIE